MTFRNLLYERLHARDKVEGSFHDIIVTNNRLLQQTIELEKRFKLNSTNASSSVVGNSEQLLELDRRIRELNEERAEMYKTQSENAQRLVTMNEQLRLKEEKENKQTEEIKHLLEKVTKLSDLVELQVQQLHEKNNTIQILQDELAALQLEMYTTEEKNKKLTAENQQLVERWINKMNEEAEKMNEATQFYETVLEQARGAADRQKVLKQSRKKSSSSNNLERSYQYSSIILPKKASKKINIHDAELHCISASSTDSIFATGGADKKIKLINAKTGHVIQTLSGSLQTITSISFNSTDEMILGSCTDNATRIWSLSTHRLKHTLTGHIGKVYSAKFTSDSNKVVSGSHDRTVKIWDLQKGYNIRTIFTFSSCNDICLMDPDGQTVISGHLDNNIRLWDARTGVGIKELTGIHNGQITSVSMSYNNNYLLTNSRDNTLKIIDIRMYETVKSFHADTYRNGLNWSRSTFSPDGNYVTAGSADGCLHIWNSRTGKLEKSIKEHSSAICGVSWSPDGDHLYSAEKNKMVCIWDTSAS
ncbi:WD40-repeat-containing domain protein [Cokeromyces recurvatus]|uniref:WD40-repeat-containing domain protein n=1 Tax=Cokeromyces recurvatus TaxID=90255 RepID=UPI00221E8542|nr:WD40-repeat-containing domain protein [Cokeromyces recurvatus]KAI7902474.1 WD40-repeat-containing domain protein [Cokeromyces recurvatus]